MTIRGFQTSEHVEWTSVGHPRRHARHVEGRAIDLDRQRFGLGVAHPSDTETGVQSSQGAREPVEVGPPPTHDTIGVVGRSLGAVCKSSRSPTIRYSTAWRSRTSIKRGRSSGGPSSLGIGAYADFLSALRLHLCQPLHHGLP